MELPSWEFLDFFTCVPSIADKTRVDLAELIRGLKLKSKRIAYKF